MKKLRVLQVNKLYYPVIGGIEKVVQQLAEGLADQVEMKVLVCQPKGRSQVEQINGIEVHRAGSLGTYFSMPVSPPFLLQLRRLAKDRDILHFHAPFPLADVAFWLLGLKKFPGRVVVWWHSDIVKQKRLRKFFYPFMKSLLNRADVIIVATEGHITGSDFLGPYKDKCVIIPFGLDRIHEIVLNLPLKVKTPAQNDSEQGPIEILFVGRLVYYKGIQTLLEAFAQTRGARLRLTGDGPLRAQLEQQARELGISGRVCFHGAVDDQELINCYKACDFLVLPSNTKSEAFGLVQIEAMAYGKPVINTDLPSGVPYVSLHGVTGLTVPPDRPDSLAQAMQLLIDQPALRRQYGVNAQKRVQEMYRLDKMLDKVMEVYQSNIDGIK